MGIEIDFLAVGDASKSGDAIAIRFGNLHGPRSEQTVITIDGGTNESGEKLVEHVKTHFGTDRLDFAFLTHPDSDHACGMRVVLEKLAVGQIVMHRPWEHSHAIHDLFDDERTTPSSISDRSKENLTAAHEIERLANEKKIQIVEPFAGLATSNGSIRVLGPTQEYYRELLSQFDYMPALVNEVVSAVFSGAARAVNWVAERWDKDLLAEPAENATSAENNSSMILLITVDGKHHLFTGDAGVPALTRALNYAALIPTDWANLNLMQAPHHGSKRNIGPTILNRIFGNIRPMGTIPDRAAFISAAKEGEPKHPSKRVTNALLRRGVKPFVTAGQGKWHYQNAPVRPTFVPVEPMPFHHNVEDDE